MLNVVRGMWHELLKDLAVCMSHPVCMGGLPALLLLLYWAWGETALVSAALAVPLLYLLLGTGKASAAMATLASSAAHGLVQRDGFELLAEHHFKRALDEGLKSAFFAVEIDDHHGLVDRYGQRGADTIVETIGTRIVSTLRNNDVVSQTGDFRFAVCLSPVRHLDLETCLQLANRLQTAIEEPVSLEGIGVYVTASIGFCQHGRMAHRDAAAWQDAATQALRDARHHGSGVVRSYSDEMRRRSETRTVLRDEVVEALETGAIYPWFQPQISTDTGLVSGFEALARWNHPKHGMIPPATFLPVITDVGLLERLAEVMMQGAFTALKAWDAAGVIVPQVGVNFAGPELNNPRLLDKVKWELDRFDLSPARLVVEVLETVMAKAPDDMVTRNIKGLGELGCRIDLDDFGTGHASIASIRRFSVSRIKIDRSFVSKSDRDPDQQRMISAILTMAERLNVETLAEGVETVGEHALLAQLGCNHVQGFGIGKPMPFDETIEWIRAHNTKLSATPKIISRH